MRVLLVRDIKSSQKTKSKLTGLEVIIKPIFKLEYLPIDSNHENYDYLVITSNNAKPLLKYFNYKTLIQIGDKYKNVYELEQKLKHIKGRVLYLRGEQVTYDFNKTRAGIEEIICYRFKPINIEIFSPEFDIVMLYSVNFAKQFLKALKGDSSNKLAICISQKVADIVSNKITVIVAKEPNEQHMIDELCKIKSI